MELVASSSPGFVWLYMYLFLAGNDRNNYNKRSGFIPDRKLIHESRGEKLISVSCCTYYEFIILHVVSDPK